MRRADALLAAFILLWTGSGAVAQGPIRVEPLAEPCPDDLSPAIRESVSRDGLRVLDADGKPWVDLWVRKEVPATQQPGEAKGTILFPFLAEGELVGVARFVGEGSDYRDQGILEGSYTLRYGLQPVNGDHLGVSTFRDYVLLVPAADDSALAVPDLDDLNLNSSNAAGTNHPAVFLLESPKEAAPAAPAVVRDEVNKRWSVKFELPAVAEGASEPTGVPMQLVLIGVGPH